MKTLRVLQKSRNPIKCDEQNSVFTPHLHKYSRMQLTDIPCSLKDGAEAEMFIVGEDTAVGSLLGTLNINGNPATDISLSVREKNPPVIIEPNTSKIILMTRLDKEGIDGPSSVHVNVICDRKYTAVPVVLIPVNIRVTDVNDNSPQWIGAPYVANISEVTSVGTRISQEIQVMDLDQPGPNSTIEFYVLPGLFSNIVGFMSPLIGILVLQNEVDYEKNQNITVQLRAQDQGVPPRYSDTIFTILIFDADDQNPKFDEDIYYGVIETKNNKSTIITYPSPIKARDQDFGLNTSIIYSIVSPSLANFFAIDSVSGTLMLTNYFNVPRTTKLLVRASQLDNTDRHALGTVIICQSVSNKTVKSGFLKTIYEIDLPENYKKGNDIIKLITNINSLEKSFKILNASEKSVFNIDGNGTMRLIGSLDYEMRSLHKFTVELTDGITSNYAEITINVINVNDWEPRFKEPKYMFHLRNKVDVSFPIFVGKVDAADGDLNDKIKYTIEGEHSDIFHVDASGKIWMKENIMKKKTFLLRLTASDSGTPPRKTTVPLVIEFQNTILNRIMITTSKISTIIISMILLLSTCCIIGYLRSKLFIKIKILQSATQRQRHCNRSKDCCIEDTSASTTSSENSDSTQTPNLERALVELHNYGLQNCGVSSLHVAAQKTKKTENRSGMYLFENQFNKKYIPVKNQ
ncbi:protocadherin Fat 2 isoform X2 [Malaya genurostris]|uniref:protocadherin Fat 2 isoform X2 n=1 Tax=Malaya genurostris TaxID=325434 RepID=UPI0026F3F236|nr:protocadherin Fat 2 isoform X2 [Malaya genurostris]